MQNYGHSVAKYNTDVQNVSNELKSPRVSNKLGRAYPHKEILKEYQSITAKPIGEVIDPKVRLGWVILGYYMLRGTPQQRVDIAKHVTRLAVPDRPSVSVDARTLVQVYVNAYHKGSEGEGQPLDITEVNEK